MKIDFAGKRLILIPLNKDKHWWVAAIDLSSGTFSVLDSLGIDHGKELETILKSLALLCFESALSFSEKSSLIRIKAAIERNVVYFVDVLLFL